MRRLLAVAVRELRERWLLFPTALVLGFNPLVLPAFGVDRQVMPLLGVVTAVGLGATAAVVIGSTMLARDAANGRLGFLFSRPLSWPAIWGGKWLAALVLVTTTGALAAIPFMAVYPSRAHGGSWVQALSDGRRWAFFLCIFVLVVGLTNFGATAFRSRSPWLALDLVLVGAALWMARQYVAPLWLYGIVGPGWGIVSGLVPLAIALLAGSAAQAAVGRTDVRRAHGAMSLVFWAIVGLTLAGAAGYWHWLRSAGPADVDVVALTRDPAGRWIYVEGRGLAGRGGMYPYAHLIDTASGSWIASPEPAYSGMIRRQGGMLFSADGRLGALPHSAERGAAVVLFDLAQSPPRVTRVSLESSPPPGFRTAFALSPKGSHVFVAHDSGASIFALPSGRRVATTTNPPGWRPAVARFVGQTSARAWLVSGDPAVPNTEMRVLDLDVDGRVTTSVFALAGGFEPTLWTQVRQVLPDAPGGRIVTLDGGTHLRDGGTGALLATLAPPGGHVPTAFLSDGRVVVAEPRPAGGDGGPPGTTLRVFDRDGAPRGELTLDLEPTRLSFGAEAAPGKIVVSSSRRPFLPQDTVLVDLAAGRVAERLSGLGAATGSGAPSPASPSSAGLESVQFFRDAAGRVIRVDFATGARTTVAGPDAPRGARLRVPW